MGQTLIFVSLQPHPQLQPQRFSTFALPTTVASVKVPLEHCSKYSVTVSLSQIALDALEPSCTDKVNSLLQLF